MDIVDLFEKGKFTASLWASSDKVFKGFPFSLVVLNWKDVIGTSVFGVFLFLILYLVFIRKDTYFLFCN